METMERRQPRVRRSFTPEFKAEIVELCQRGDRSIGQVTRDFDLTETAVRQWVRQAERDAGTSGRRRADQHRTPRAVGPAPGAPTATAGPGDPQASDGVLRQGDPVNVDPFIEAEKAQQRNVKRACALPEVSRAADYATAPASRRHASSPTTSSPSTSASPPGVQGPLRRAQDPRRTASTRPSARQQAGGQAAAGSRPGWSPTAPVEADHDPRSGGHRPGRPDPPRRHRQRRRGQHPLVWRHHLHPRCVSLR
jgi:transposase-like protein